MWLLKYVSTPGMCTIPWTVQRENSPRTAKSRTKPTSLHSTNSRHFNNPDSRFHNQQSLSRHWTVLDQNWKSPAPAKERNHCKKPEMNPTLASPHADSAPAEYKDVVLMPVVASVAATSRLQKTWPMGILQPAKFNLPKRDCKVEFFALPGGRNRPLQIFKYVQRQTTLHRHGVDDNTQKPQLSGWALYLVRGQWYTKKLENMLDRGQKRGIDSTSSRPYAQEII